MNRLACLVLVCVLATTCAAQLTGTSQHRVAYTLLDASYLVDECLICGRPTILEPLRGTFDLVVLQDLGTYITYNIENARFHTGPEAWRERALSGNGTYIRFEEVARIQDMQLTLLIKDFEANHLAFFTNGTPLSTAPAPLIQATLTQSNGTLAQTFSLHLFAAPVREIWFSTVTGFTSSNRNPPTNQVTDGDLLSNRGNIVKRNIDLVGRLGLMPVVGNLGLDAVYPAKAGLVLFSLPHSVFSERLGYLQHGDVLASSGEIFQRNQQLLAAFKPVSTNDAGLDALAMTPNGDFLFSIQSNVVLKSGLTLSRGDILSQTGAVVVPFKKLIEKFHPTATVSDFGIDAFSLLPYGEIWFSVEQGFTDTALGPISAGDLLSDLGHRVLRISDLVKAFAPAETTKDFGLDALFVISDTEPAKDPPRLASPWLTSGRLGFNWQGGGTAFQLEQAPGPSGPWSPITSIMPDVSWITASPPSSNSAAFFRLRQW